jgi:Sigma-54 interaction domain
VTATSTPKAHGGAIVTGIRPRPPEEAFEHVVGRSRALRHALDQVDLVAPTDATVLVRGEMGTGKELIARVIHDQSGRHARRFVKINCAAIPSGLFESELFGHERGAFTAAVAQRVGRFELASGDTLFLDEVGDIPLELQAKLLRVLQEQEFERLGATRKTKVDIRLVAATNRDLREMMQTVRFRDDLYYRLNVFPIAVPPLRRRPEDDEPLVRHFVARFARRMQRRIETISDDTLAALRRHPWPGNVRELENPDGGECTPRCDASSRCRRDFLWDSGMSVPAGAGPREAAGSVNLARQFGDHVVTDLPRDVVQRTASLRITISYQLAAETGAAYILELKGELQGDSVEELRQAWRPLRDAVAGVPIRVVLADVEFVDAAGKALLAEIHRAGTMVV